MSGSITLPLASAPNANRPGEGCRASDVALVSPPDGKARPGQCRAAAAERRAQQIVQPRRSGDMADVIREPPAPDDRRSPLRVRSRLCPAASVQRCRESSLPLSGVPARRDQGARSGMTALTVPRASRVARSIRRSASIRLAAAFSRIRLIASSVGLDCSASSDSVPSRPPLRKSPEIATRGRAASATSASSLIRSSAAAPTATSLPLQPRVQAELIDASLDRNLAGHAAGKRRAQGTAGRLQIGILASSVAASCRVAGSKLPSPRRSSPLRSSSAGRGETRRRIALCRAGDRDRAAGESVNRGNPRIQLFDRPIDGRDECHPGIAAAPSRSGSAHPRSGGRNMPVNGRRSATASRSRPSRSCPNRRSCRARDIDPGAPGGELGHLDGACVGRTAASDHSRSRPSSRGAPSGIAIPRTDRSP